MRLGVNGSFPEVLWGFDQIRSYKSARMSFRWREAEAVVPTPEVERRSLERPRVEGTVSDRNLWKYGDLGDVILEMFPAIWEMTASRQWGCMVWVSSCCRVVSSALVIYSGRSKIVVQIW